MTASTALLLELACGVDPPAPQSSSKEAIADILATHLVVLAIMANLLTRPTVAPMDQTDTKLNKRLYNSTKVTP